MRPNDLQPYSAYKDSGIEWLGDVPAHWEVRRFKYLLRSATTVLLTAASNCFAYRNTPESRSVNGQRVERETEGLPAEIIGDGGEREE